MPRPLIGITADYNDRQTAYASPYGYAASVEKAGGMPVILPYRLADDLLPELLGRLDGILFSGGDDLDPALFGQEPHPKSERIDLNRQAFELKLLKRVEATRLPLLGVCLGCQIINVHRGGSLHQWLGDIDRPDYLEHRRLDDWGRRHAVHIRPGTLLAERIGKSQLQINTSHKQAINQLGTGLTVSATAPDGIVEAVEDRSLPLFLGVQWHPERLAGEDDDELKLFKLLIEKSTQYRAGKS